MASERALPVPHELRSLVCETRPLFLPALPSIGGHHHQHHGQHGSKGRSSQHDEISAASTSSEPILQISLADANSVEAAILLVEEFVASAWKAGLLVPPALVVAPQGHRPGKVRSAESRSNPVTPATQSLLSPRDERLSSRGISPRSGVSTASNAAVDHPFLVKKIASCLCVGFGIVFPPQKLAQWLRHAAQTTPPRAAMLRDVIASLVGSVPVQCYLHVHLGTVTWRPPRQQRERSRSRPAATFLVSTSAEEGSSSLGARTVADASSEGTSSDLQDFCSDLLRVYLLKQIDANEMLGLSSRLDTVAHLHSCPMAYFPTHALRVQGSMLTTLSLRFCALPSISGIERCNSLEILNLSNNRLRSIPFDVFHFQNLRQLLLDCNLLEELPQPGSGALFAERFASAGGDTAGDGFPLSNDSISAGSSATSRSFAGSFAAGGLSSPKGAAGSSTSPSAAAVYRRFDKIVGGCRKLEVFTASRNQLVDIPPYFCLFHKLGTWDVSYNQIQHLDVNLLLGKASLRQVLLFGNPLENAKQVHKTAVGARIPVKMAAPEATVAAALPSRKRTLRYCALCVFAVLVLSNETNRISLIRVATPIIVNSNAAEVASSERSLSGGEDEEKSVLLAPPDTDDAFCASQATAPLARKRPSLRLMPFSSFSSREMTKGGAFRKLHAALFDASSRGGVLPIAAPSVGQLEGESARRGLRGAPTSLNDAVFATGSPTRGRRKRSLSMSISQLATIRK